MKLKNRLGLEYEVTGDNENLIVTHNGKSIKIALTSLQNFINGWIKWRDGALIQNAFPFLTPDEREFLMTGITADEWDILFKE